MAERGDRGETFMHAFGIQVTQIQILAIGSLGQHLAENRTGDYIARGQLGQFVVARHKTLTSVIAQIRPLATHGFRD